MSKPEGARERPCNTEITQAAVIDTLNEFGFNPIQHGMLITIRVSVKGDLVLAASLVEWLLNEFRNIAVNLMTEDSYHKDEWSIHNAENGRSVWNGPF